MRTIFTLVLLLTGLHLQSQELRYFEFVMDCGHGNWQDTSCIAATSDQTLIGELLAEMVKPYEERRFINGPIAHGNGGHNRNADHWFAWHFLPNQWELAEMTLELCDGCPYTDLDLATAYWVDTVGRFCPWSGKPAREVAPPLQTKDPAGALALRLFPNPATDRLILQGLPATGQAIRIFDAYGREALFVPLLLSNEIEVGDLLPGMYFLQVVQEGRPVAVRSFVVGR
jgi:hypothetical protein